MKTYTFPYNISSGKLAFTECAIDVELTDEDAERLEKSAKEGGRKFLSEDPEIDDIRDLVLSAAYEEQKEYYRNDPMEVIEFLEEEFNYDEDEDEDFGDEDEDEIGRIDPDNITDEQIEYYLNSFDFSILYPEEI